MPAQSPPTVPRRRKWRWSPRLIRPRNVSKASPGSSTRPSAVQAPRSVDGEVPDAEVASARTAHYIDRAGLRGSLGDNSPGPYDPNGSCPWLEPWFRLYGAHLLM